MRLSALRAALALLAVAAPATPAQAYDERPMRLPATGGPGAAAASAQPATWLVAAEPGARAARAAAIAGRFGARRLRIGTVYRVPTRRARAFAAALRDAGALRYAEPDAALTRQSAFDADPGGYARGYLVEPDLSPPAPGNVAIAVVDDLVDVAHPDLAGHTSQLNPGPVLAGHGTEVASAAAASFNGFGVVGVFPGAPVLSVGLPLKIRCSDATNGILAAANAGAKVINLSFGSTSDCATMFGAVQIAFAKGSLVVAASGNEFAQGNPVIFPAAYPHVLSVASLDPNLRSSGFSSANAAVDVAAPGVAIPVATPAAYDPDGVPDGVTLASGTSFAAPLVSGAAAWLATVRGDLSNGQLADVLRRSARDIPPAGYDRDTGFGLVHMRAALALPAPARDVLEPNDGISFVNGSVFTEPDPYVWRGSGRRTLGGSADRVEDPFDVYRIRLPRRSRARIRLRPAFGNPDLYVFRSSARSIDDSRHIIARSRKGTLRTDAVTIRNPGRTARRFYVAIGIGETGGGLNASYSLQFQRTKFR
ncbi:MAG: S8 family serine peptidase [Solirubrobacteraceae bacterium]|nr:S8 family serine peptidase [Solirubrobacteraceae bacterium]